MTAGDKLIYEGLASEAPKIDPLVNDMPGDNRIKVWRGSGGLTVQILEIEEPKKPDAPGLVTDKAMDPTAAKAEILRFIAGLPEGTRISIDRPAVEIPPKGGYRQYKAAPWITLIVQEPTEPATVAQDERLERKHSKAHAEPEGLRRDVVGRQALIEITPELVGQAFQPGNEIHAKLLNGWRDMKVVGVAMAPDKNLILLKVESPDLPEVALGEKLPYISPTFRTVPQPKTEGLDVTGPAIEGSGFYISFGVDILYDNCVAPAPSACPTR